MTNIDDITLLAYVDGELDAAMARTVEQSLQDDPRMTREVRRLRESATLIRAAVNEPVHGPVPRSLVRTLDSAIPKSAPEPRRQWLFATGIAAMIALGTGAGFLVGTLAPRVESNLAADEELMDDIVAYYAFYASVPPAVASERPDHPLAMEKWLSSQMQQAVRIPDLGPKGYRFETARLLVYEDRPIAQIVYESTDSSLVALCVVAAEKAEMRSFELIRRRGFTLITWQRAKTLYVVIGAVPDVRLREFSAAISAALQQI